MLDAKKYTVQISGETYVLISTATATKVEDSVACVDALMREISASNVSTSLKKAAVLAALKLSLEVQDLKAELDQAQQAAQNMLMQLEAV